MTFTRPLLFLIFLLVVVKFFVRLRVSTYNKRIWWWWIIHERSIQSPVMRKPASSKYEGGFKRWRRPSICPSVCLSQHRRSTCIRQRAPLLVTMQWSLARSDTGSFLSRPMGAIHWFTVRCQLEWRIISRCTWTTNLCHKVDSNWNESACVSLYFVLISQFFVSFYLIVVVLFTFIIFLSHFLV